MQLLTENCKAVDLEQRLSSVALVIFNYDRCIEHYMYHWLQNYYSINNSLAAKLLQGLEIYHPYGTVGSLPWLSSKNAIDYGATPTPKQLLELASQIKTFTEGTDETSSNVNAIRSHMKMTNKLIFLGFAFHKLNMELLIQTGSAKVNGISQSIFATAHGISGSDSEDIRVELSNALSTSKTYLRRDLKCNQLFQEFRRKLSFV